jgi:ketosteroid isomerase-like protein
VEQIIANGKTVVVLGSEKQKIKNNGKILEQKWVQVYTVEDGLISKMEEFANTAYSEKLFKK